MMDNQENRSRRIALAVFAGVIVLFIVLSGASFVQARQRAEPAAFVFQGQSAVDGKRVFQAYDCMGCHTMLGNGAYFGPDLTNIYEDGGPAWLLAFLSSPGAWPTEPALRIRVEQLNQSGDLDTASIDEYLQRYPHVKEAIELLGGQRTVMPNLRLNADEISALVAFFNYTAEIDTAGWPPARMADASVIEELQGKYGLVPPEAGGEASPTPVEPPSASVQGEQLAQQLGCLACHSIDGSETVGPTWKGLLGSTVALDDGSTVTADEAYLRESILAPDAKIVQGFFAGIMPAFEGQLSPEDLDALIAYLSSLE